MSKYKIGMIGGSGLYHIEGFTSQKWVKVKTPFGAPSDDFLTGKLAGREVVFLPRHGRGHRILPSELNHRANLWAMKKLGVAWVISVSAVGSLQSKYRPCDIVLPDQFVDRTKRDPRAHLLWPRHRRPRRVRRPGQRGTAGGFFSRPAKPRGKPPRTARLHDGGTYVNMEGPAFSTRAESLTNHRQGYDVIGMTNLGEAKCAREAEIAYATMAMITDYDCWKVDEAHVTVEMIIANLMKNAATAKAIVARVLPHIPAEPNWPCHDALKNAIMTDRKLWPRKVVADLRPILAKYL